MYNYEVVIRRTTGAEESFYVVAQDITAAALKAKKIKRKRYMRYDRVKTIKEINRVLA